MIEIEELKEMPRQKYLIFEVVKYKIEDEQGKVKKRLKNLQLIESANNFEEAKERITELNNNITFPTSHYIALLGIE